MTDFAFACSSGQAAPTIPYPGDGGSLQTQPTRGFRCGGSRSPCNGAVLPTATFIPKPPLAKDAWKQMPAVPRRSAMRCASSTSAVWLSAMTPTISRSSATARTSHLIFFPCLITRMSSAWASEYAYLQPTIDYFQKLLLAQESGSERRFQRRRDPFTSARGPEVLQQERITAGL